MAQQTISGACHCGKVRIEADLDLAAGTNRCNCSICGKLRLWGAIARPQNFRLLAGEADLSSYEWGPKISTRMFCKHCGLHVFSRGHLEEIGADYCSINVAVLDLAPAVLDSLPIRYFDGLHNNWETPPQHTKYL